MKKLLFVLAVLFVVISCKKDHAPGQPPVNSTDTVLLTDTYFYSSLDTSSKSLVRHDHIRYNKDWRIDSIRSYFPNKPGDSLLSAFVYNGDGNVQQMMVWAPTGSREFFRNYTLQYDAQKKIISLDYFINTYGLAFSFSYNSSGRLQQYEGHFNYDYLGNTNPDFIRKGDPYAAGRYYWNSSGGLDSIYSGVPAAVIGGDTVYDRTSVILNGPAILPVNVINKSYLLALSWSWEQQFLMDGYFNIFLHQYLNPDISLLRGGTYSTATVANKPIDFSAGIYTDGRLQWMFNSLKDQYGGWKMMKLVYTKLN